MTYLELVNEVLLRLREDTVSTVTQSQYSKLIGAFVNDAKRSVEDAYQWDALNTTLTITTTPGTATYTVTGSGRRPKDISVNNGSDRNKMFNVSIKWIEDQTQLSTVQNGAPCYYAWNGTDGTDSKVTVFPTPDRTSTIYFNLNVPQGLLTSDADSLMIPHEAVVLGAYARAVAERGEDGGLASSEAYALYKTILADQIAVESTRFIENDCWEAV